MTHERMNHNNDTYMQETMLLQLHEQYAVNNNAKLESAVTLIVGLLAVIGAYGFVFLHVDEFLVNLSFSHEFTLNGLLLTATATTIVLAIMSHICMYQGFAQRKGQFIIYAIRRHYKLGIIYNDKRIFPDSYHPFNKKFLEIYQGLFGEFIKIILVIQFIIFTTKIIIWCIYGDKIDNRFARLYFVVFVCCLIFHICIYYLHRRKYKDLCENYKEYKVKDKN